jgi:hypothetical protein
VNILHDMDRLPNIKAVQVVGTLTEIYNGSVIARYDVAKGRNGLEVFIESIIVQF